jgi:hypothetical protein
MKIHHAATQVGSQHIYCMSIDITFIGVRHGHPVSFHQWGAYEEDCKVAEERIQYVQAEIRKMEEVLASLKVHKIAEEDFLRDMEGYRGIASLSSYAHCKRRQPPYRRDV